MGIEIDLLRNYPQAKRDLDSRTRETSENVKLIAREFGQEFFDGERKFGYGGFSYDERFWSPVIPDFESHFKDLASKSLLDVGCAKGFMLFELKKMVPGIKVAGIDISKYAIANCLPSVREDVQVGNAVRLPFRDDSFDIVISINTVHNLELEDCKEALREISRVAQRGSFVTVDAYSNEQQRERMFAWNLTAKTILSVEEWKSLFEEVGYAGDYYWFMP
jgi:SAM-dependent methyltransferase